MKFREVSPDTFGHELRTDIVLAANELALPLYVRSHGQVPRVPATNYKGRIGL